ncbi:hypothetical protein C2G38_1111407 [Gigaspora rosea]|uniref:Uncharacterized protein n=1 Tax=Gigaspora rosea TaxID=44941 RepID=A0A397VH90_9GLOM|nr:hypothetical protein C2G38_1111407 [Gigaspora rosea]
MSNNTTIDEQICMIQGDSDIIGPGVRLSNYLQVMLIFVKILVLEENFIESAENGLITIICLFIAAIIQSNINGIHEVYLMILSQFGWSLYMASMGGIYYAGTHGNFKPEHKKKLKKFSIVMNLTGILYICYNIWFWANIRFSLPQQICGDKIKIYFFFIPLDPTGWIRDFYLILFCIGLSGIGLSVILISFCNIIYFILRKPNRNIEHNLPREDSVSLSSSIPILNCCSKCCICIFALLIFGVLIGSIEITVQKNPIMGIWEWSFGQILVMVITSVDLLNTVISIINLCVKFYKETIEESKSVH